MIQHPVFFASVVFIAVVCVVLIVMGRYDR